MKPKPLPPQGNGFFAALRLFRNVATAPARGSVKATAIAAEHNGTVDSAQAIFFGNQTRPPQVLFRD